MRIFVFAENLAIFCIPFVEKKYKMFAFFANFCVKFFARKKTKNANDFFASFRKVYLRVGMENFAKKLAKYEIKFLQNFAFFRESFLSLEEKKKGTRFNKKWKVVEPCRPKLNHFSSIWTGGAKKSCLTSLVRFNYIYSPRSL